MESLLYIKALGQFYSHCNVTRIGLPSCMLTAQSKYIITYVGGICTNTKAIIFKVFLSFLGWLLLS